MDQSEDIAILKEKVRAIEAKQSDFCTFRMKTIRRCQKYDDYCRGREHLPDELIETQDELLKLRHAFDAYIKDYENITKPRIDTLYNLVMKVVYTVGAATFIMACIVGYTTLSGLFE